MEFEFKDIKYDYGKFKVNTNKLYTKQELDTFLNDRYTKDQTYSKTELNNLITTPNVSYVTVPTYASLPSTGSANTIYRVSNYNGSTSQVDASVYSEYAWDGNDYVFLRISDSTSEVFDISVYKNNTAFANLSEALGNNGVNVPVEARQPGMSVKFIQSSDNNYMHYNLLANEFTTDVTKWAVYDVGVYVDNPEFTRVYTDKDDRILWAIKADGSIYYGAGVPPQIIDYIQQKIDELSLDEYEDIVSFLNGLEEGDKTLTELLAEKVDKEEGKSLIDAEYAVGISYIENHEFTVAYLDSENKILFGICANGDFYFGYGVPSQIIDYVNNHIAEIITSLNNKVDKEAGKGLSANDYTDDDKNVVSRIRFEERDGYLLVLTDADKKLLFTIGIDGSVDWNIGVPQCVKEFVNTVVNNAMQGFTDTYHFIEDIERRLEIKLAADNTLIISYRKEDGTLVEYGGIETPRIVVDDIKAGNVYIDQHIILSKEAKEDIINALPEDMGKYKSPNLPKYGTTNLKTETFYLTAYEGVEDIDDVVLIQDFEDTNENALKRMTICHYYVKSTLTDNGDGTYSVNENSVRLQHYAAGKVKLNTTDNKYYAKDPVRKIDGVCYYADTLGYSGTAAQMGTNRNVVIEGYTRIAPADPDLAEGAVKQTNVEVVQITGPVCVDAWTVEDWDFNASLGADIGKKYEHNCIGDVDFGHYLSGTDIAIGVKHQGNSTQIYRKRNFRYTFYKNATFAKKDKKKIGEMLRLSKFNLKANWNDNSRIKESILYRIVTEIWQNHRPITDRYNWDGGANGYYHGATGNIKAFPIKFSVAGDFYGVYMFCLPKDGSNYIIDDKDDSTGLLVSGAHNTNNDWGVTLPYNIADPRYGHYDSEMDSDFEDYPDIVKALERWTDFINNRLYVGEDGNEYGIEECTFTGSDGNYYTYSQVTFNSSEGKWYHNDIEIVKIYVTDMYWDTNRNTYHRSEVTRISGVNYVTASLTEIIDPVSGDITYEVNETSIVVTHFTIGDNIEFNKENAYSRLDVLGFIDYFICMQVFVMCDNTHNNIIMYSGPKKKKMFPFFYDLDWSMPDGASYGYDCDILSVSYSNDTSLWRNIRDIYWDDIVNRYCELRKSVLTDSYIEKVYKEFADNIPSSDYTLESSKWGGTCRASNFETKLIFINKRLKYLDENYFII